MKPETKTQAVVEKKIKEVDNANRQRTESNKRTAEHNINCAVKDAVKFNFRGHMDKGFHGFGEGKFLGGGKFRLNNLTGEWEKIL